MPQIQGVQGRSRSNLLRALGNEGDEVSPAFPKGEQKGVFLLFHISRIEVFQLIKEFHNLHGVQAFLNRSPFCLRSIRVLVEFTNPPPINLSLNHSISNIVNIFQFEFFRNQFVEFEILSHG